MDKQAQIWIVLITIFFLVIGSVVSVKSNYDEEDLSEIKVLLYQYFDLIYESKKINELKDLTSVLDLTSSQGLEEIKKQELEIYVNKLNNLNYDSYKYYLEFSNFSIDKEKKIASINVEERNEVIFNIAISADIENPVVSQMKVIHEFHFIKGDEGWIIESDFYEDDLWKILNNEKLSISEYKSKIDKKFVSQSYFVSDPFENTQTVLSGLCPYLWDDSTSHEYDRQGATVYAQRYALNYNPNYVAFESDCTNFVS